MSATLLESSIATRPVRLPSGIRLDCAEQGDPRGLPVLFLHGYTDSWRSFATVLDHLPGGLRAIAVSLRGHGDSDRPAAGYHAHDFARDLAALTDVLNVARAVVVGHSMGTQVALRVAVDHPARVLGLVLIGGYVSMRANPVVQELWASQVSRLVDPIDPAFVRDFQASTVAQAVPQRVIDGAVAESLKVPARIWRAACVGMLHDDPSAELHRIDAPTLLLWGDQDGICRRADQDALAAGIRSSRLITYRGGGHAPHWEEPARVARDIAAFGQEHV
jgi:pimeloyl-ACP methyl ester carboxylesterase